MGIWIEANASKPTFKSILFPPHLFISPLFPTELTFLRTQHTRPAALEVAKTTLAAKRNVLETEQARLNTALAELRKEEEMLRIEGGEIWTSKVANLLPSTAQAEKDYAEKHLELLTTHATAATAEHGVEAFGCVRCRSIVSGQGVVADCLHGKKCAVAIDAANGKFLQNQLHVVLTRWQCT